MIELSLIWKVIVVVGSIMLGVGTYKYFGMKPDNKIEEIAEEVIKEETGLNVDLSPEKETQ